jgi:hypothetical protein
MQLLIKRHPPVDPNTGQPLQSLTEQQKIAAPAPEQISVGELAINTITGKLYTKLLDGSIVEFVSQKICFEPVPDITVFYENRAIAAPDYLIENFCCSGGLLTIVVNKLKLDPVVYNFFLNELTNNSSTELIRLEEPSYEIYTETVNDEIITYRKATIPIFVEILPDNYNNISLFKFSVVDANNPLIISSERILTFRCLEGEI